MRQVINISLPEELNSAVEGMVKKGRYSTKSEFLRDLIRERIAEEDILARVERSRREIRAGKGKVLKPSCELD